jgi:alpha-L-fucosidase 2
VTDLMTTDAYTTLRYRDPAESWTDALPLGNGRLGAMCFGGIELDRFQLNEGSCWSGSPATTRDTIADGPLIVRAAREALAAGDVRAAEDELARLQGGHSQAYQPLADLWIEQHRPDPVPDGYLRHLDLRTAVASHTYRTPLGRVSQEAWISAPAQAMVIRRRAQEDQPVLIRLDSPHPSAVASPVTGGLDLVVRMPSSLHDDEAGAAVTAVVGLRILSAGAMTLVDGARLRVDGSTELILVVGVVTDYVDPLTAPHGDVGALRRAVDDRLGGLANALVRPGGYPALRAAHERDHARLFSRAALRLGPPPASGPLDTADRVAAGDPSLPALQFQYGRYLLISSSRPGSLPANLQGLWNDHLRPPWSSNYTTNINLEMNYWPVEVANLSECHRPLLDWLGFAARRGAAMARNLYGTSGWTLHHNSDAWCFCLPADGDASWSFWPLAGAWLSRQIVEHYDYTGDGRFLTERGWPLLRSAAEFCLDWLIPLPDGTLGTSPSTSPENKFVAPDGKPAAASVSTTADLVLIRDLLASVVRLAPAGDPIGVRSQSALDLLPSERIAPDGRIAEWSADLADTEPGHRHTSHLIGVYPGHSIDPSTTPALAAAALRTLDARGPESTGWSLAWRIALRARLHDADGAYAAVQRFLRPAGEHSGVYRNLFCAHPPFQIDGNFGFTAGVAEMLLQSQESTAAETVVHLLPAVPAAWSEGAFAGLRARGGVTVDAEWSGGRVREIRLLSDTDRHVVIRAGDERVSVRTSAHVPYRHALAG